jgi:hypothetical protein
LVVAEGAGVALAVAPGDGSGYANVAAGDVLGEPLADGDAELPGLGDGEAEGVGVGVGVGVGSGGMMFSQR